MTIVCVGGFAFHTQREIFNFQENVAHQGNLINIKRTKRPALSFFDHFFSPLKCPRDERNRKACPLGGAKDYGSCLNSGCCPDRSPNTKIKCYAQVIDKPQRMLRLFVVGGVGALMVVCTLPVVCHIFQGSTSANSLRREYKTKQIETKDDRISSYILNLLTEDARSTGLLCTFSEKLALQYLSKPVGSVHEDVSWIQEKGRS
nr:PREDICTED: uncharacterized protein LOC106702791 [Latimeria chalumnae]|eukprot:XP_014341505.1 PREDICTED: uncharacterized protein LOC106702791 [Latimeria chalumnae]